MIKIEGNIDDDWYSSDFLSDPAASGDERGNENDSGGCQVQTGDLLLCFLIFLQKQREKLRLDSHSAKCGLVICTLHYFLLLYFPPRKKRKREKKNEKTWKWFERLPSADRWSALCTIFSFFILRQEEWENENEKNENEKKGKCFERLPSADRWSALCSIFFILLQKETAAVIGLPLICFWSFEASFWTY